MCLVSFVPLPDKNYILSSNRDESPLRSVHELAEEYINGQHLLYPMDSKGGSWILTSNKDVSICLLNGALTKHKHIPPYKISRGIMLKDFFTYPGLQSFTQEYDFEGIEPFTCVVIEKDTLHELYWTGSQLTVNALPFDTWHVWSSASLYTPEIKQKRQNRFSKLYNDLAIPSPIDIKNIHLSGGADDEENGFVMNRNGQVQTVSFTQICRINQRVDFSFINLLEHGDNKLHRSFHLHQSE